MSANETFKNFFERAEIIKSEGLGKIIAEAEGKIIYERRIKLLKSFINPEVRKDLINLGMYNSSMEPQIYGVFISRDDYSLENNKLVKSRIIGFEIKYFGLKRDEAINEFNKIFERDRLAKN